MRCLIAIGMLVMTGCSTELILIEDLDQECDISEITKNESNPSFYTETYQCTNEPVYDRDRFFAPVDNIPPTDMALLSINGPL